MGVKRTWQTTSSSGLTSYSTRSVVGNGIVESVCEDVLRALPETIYDMEDNALYSIIRNGPSGGLIPMLGSCEKSLTMTATRTISCCGKPVARRKSDPRPRWSNLVTRPSPRVNPIALQEPGILRYKTARLQAKKAGASFCYSSVCRTLTAVSASAR